MGWNWEFSLRDWYDVVDDEVGEENHENGQFYMISTEIWIFKIIMETQTSISDEAQHEV